MEPEDIMARLAKMRQACSQPHQGSGTLLEIDKLFWTEKLLLQLVRALYSRRLQQIGAYLPDDMGEAQWLSLML